MKLKLVHFVSFSSLQVEVTVTLVPPAATSNMQTVVLILSSMVPVNWAIITHGLRGQISVHVRDTSVFVVSYYFQDSLCV